VCIDAFIADDESEAKAIRAQPKYDDKQNRFFAGSPPQFEEHLSEICDEYQTRNVILSTLRGPSDLEQQFHSFEIAMQCAQRVSK